MMLSTLFEVAGTSNMTWFAGMAVGREEPTSEARASFYRLLGTKGLEDLARRAHYLRVLDFDLCRQYNRQVSWRNVRHDSIDLRPYMFRKYQQYYKRPLR